MYSLGSTWTQTKQLQLLPIPSPNLEIDKAMFVLGDVNVILQIDMTVESYAQHGAALLGAMVQLGDLGVATTQFDCESADPINRALAHEEEALGEMWNYSE